MLIAALGSVVAALSLGEVAAAQTVRVAPPKKSRAAKAQDAAPAASTKIPIGWTCVGGCGTDAADGVVPLSPTGNPAYEWVSTTGGVSGIGTLPSGALGQETDGSTLATPVFSATAGTPLNFYFNYVTSDGAQYTDYAWAELFTSSNVPVALLFTARTEVTGSIVPGSGLPPPMATLTPASVPIVAGGPDWSPLGENSGDCYDVGCGYSGWVRANYVIPTTGNYYLKVGVVNWIDEIYDSGLAVDGVTIGGAPITELSGNLEVEYGTDTAQTSWLGLATATNSSGTPLDIKDAATMLGFDHFNWLQIINSDLQLQACASPTAPKSECASDFTMTGKVPPIPTPDPPLGGYAYELCPSGPGCQTTFPVQDLWPMYLDEYFSPEDEYYKANPSHPEYLQEFRTGNTLAQMGADNQDPKQALGFSFSDSPSTAGVTVPGEPSASESISFVDALVGVNGVCNVLVKGSCSFQIIPGTTFRWTATNGLVSPTLTPGGPGTSAWLKRTAQTRQAKHLNDFPAGPVDLTGAQLAKSIISIEQFLDLAHLTPQSLASMGGGISIYSASLVPSEAAALAAALANAPQQTLITISSSPAAGLKAGQPLTVTAVVKPASGTGIPTGKVTFSSPNSASTIVVNLDPSGKAVLNTIVPASGTYTVVASYSGSSVYGTSVAVPDTQIVEAP